MAENNNLYFNSSCEGGLGDMDIYLSKFIDGEYDKPENLLALNPIHAENDLMVDPKERFIIFNRYVDADCSIDLYISCNKNGKWSEPRKLDYINSDTERELTPTLSPDGKHFFF